MEYKGIEVIITYKRIKRINAHIRDAKILISAPYFTKNSEIIRFLDLYYNRIEKIVNKQKEIDPNIMYLWGNKYNIVKIEATEEKVVIMEDIAYVFYKKNYLDVIDDFYKKETLEHISVIAKKYTSFMVENDIMFNKLIIKKMKSRWGSCLISKRNITINSNLAKYEELCLEYVFCHEIAHLKYANHSKRFHDFIYTYFKDEKLARKNLKKYY